MENSIINLSKNMESGERYNILRSRSLHMEYRIKITARHNREKGEKSFFPSVRYNNKISIIISYDINDIDDIRVQRREKDGRNNTAYPSAVYNSRLYRSNKMFLETRQARSSFYSSVYWTCGVRMSLQALRHFGFILLLFASI